MRRLLLRLLLPHRAALARTIEESMREDQLQLSRRERRLLTAQVLDALSQIGICPK